MIDEGDSKRNSGSQVCSDIRQKEEYFQMAHPQRADNDLEQVNTENIELQTVLLKDSQRSKDPHTKNNSMPNQVIEKASNPLDDELLAKIQQRKHKLKQQTQDTVFRILEEEKANHQFE